ncbi:SPAG5 protein, partial [Malurus elegans]|nr:SPAG5 protein [Malurus elegans]
DGSAGPLPCQGTPEGVESPAPVPPEQSPAGLPPIEANGLEPARSEAIVTPVTSPESTLGAVSWMLPLVWLEKTLNTSFLVESLQHSLPLHKPQQDASSMSTVVTGTSMTPVPTAVAGTSTTPVSTTAFGTSMTPVPIMATGTSMSPVATMATGTFMTPRDVWERSMNTSRGSLPSAKDSAAETDSLLWHCPREQLKALPRAELEGRLESTLIIIEALSLQLRHLQDSQRPRSGVGPAEQRDALTQTDITLPEGVRVLRGDATLSPAAPVSAMQDTRTCPVPAALMQLSLSLPQHTWNSQCLLSQVLTGPAFQSLQDEQGALVPEQEQQRTLVSQCLAVPESAPSKLKSCLEERDAVRQRVDE